MNTTRLRLSPVPWRAAIVLILALVGGLFVGLFTFMIKQAFDLLFILPLGVGLVCGLALMWTIYEVRMPSRPVAIIAGVIVATSIYGVVHYYSYLVFIAEAARVLRARGLAGTPAEIDAVLAARTGLTGFLGVLSFRAQQGLGIRPLYSDITTPVNAAGTWSYWVLEWVLSGLACAFVASSATTKPFCPTCASWYQSAHLGSVQQLLADPFLDCLRAGAFAEAHEYLEQSLTSLPSLEVYVQHCPTCATQPRRLTVKQATDNPRGGAFLSEVLTQTISAQAHRELTRGKDGKSHQ